MSLLSRLRDWFASLFGSDGEAAGESTPAADHVCTVCGTAVEDPSEGCPLCGSLDVEPRAAADATGPADAAGNGGAASGDATADSRGTGTPGPHRQSVEGTTDDAVTRLRDVRRGAEDGAEAGVADGDEAASDGTDPPDGDSNERPD